MNQAKTLARYASYGIAGSLAILYVWDVAYAYNFITTYYLEDEENSPEDELLVDEFLDAELAKNVDKAQFDQSLRDLSQELVPGYGLFEGKDDPAMKIARELIVGFGGARAVMLQIAHPFVNKGIALHSNVWTSPYERAVKTQVYTLTMFYGSQEQIIRASKIVRSLHNTVNGKLGEDVGIFRKTTTYDATQAHAIHWVAATMPETVKFSFELLERKLTTEELDALVRLMNRFLMCFGMKSPHMTYAEYIKFYRAVYRSDKVLNVTESTKLLTKALFVAPHWTMSPLSFFLNWFVMLQMPPKLQKKFFHPVSKFEYFLFALIVGQNRVVQRFLPEWFRFLSPYHRMMDKNFPEARSEIYKSLSENLAFAGDYLLRLLLPEKDRRKEIYSS